MVDTEEDDILDNVHEDDDDNNNLARNHTNPPSTTATTRALHPSASAPVLSNLNSSGARTQNTTNPLSYSSVSLGSPLNALSISPSATLIAAGGRDTLQVVSVHGNNPVVLSISKNIRMGKRSKFANLTSSANDIRWHPTEEQLFVTAATNSAVVLWNLNSNKLQERVWTSHERSVNRVCWQPREGHTILSASQDGTVRLWDIRTDGDARIIMCASQPPPQPQPTPTPTLTPTTTTTTTAGIGGLNASVGMGAVVMGGSGADSVRDVEFNPFATHTFAAGYESGCVLLWDLRNPRTFERRITGHDSYIFSIAWHPDQRHVIATGGRDCMVKVWDTTQPSRPTHVIQTISSVCRVRWRGGSFPSHIATTSQPSMPVDCDVYVWDVHTPFVPVMAFAGHRAAATSIEWGTKQYAHCIFSCSKDSTVMAHQIRTASLPHKHLPVNPVSWAPNGHVAFVQGHINRNMDATLISGPAHSTQHHHQFSVTSVQSANAEQYEQQKRVVWECIFGSKGETVTAEFDEELDVATIRLFGEQYVLDNTSHSVEYCCIHNSKVAFSAKKYSVAHTWLILGQLFETENSNSNNPGPYQRQRHKSFEDESRGASIPLDFLFHTTKPPQNDKFPGPGVERVSHFDEFSSESDDEDDDNDSEYGNSFATGNPLNLWDKPEPFDLSAQNWSPSMVPTTMKPDTPVLNPLFADLNQRLALDLVEFYAEHGDVQMCCALVIVLNGRVNVDTAKVRLWFSSYLDLLMRYQLWDIACELIGFSPDEGIRAFNRALTTISVGCGSCSKSLPSEPPLVSHNYNCTHCHKPNNKCSLCEMPVRGCFVWCRKCGHGGHLQHMRSWFAEHTFCPTGCKCQCNHSELFREATNTRAPNWEAGRLRVPSGLRRTGNSS